MHQFQVKNNFRKCAFCKNWYDPTNSEISPKTRNIGIWEYEERRQEKCLVRNAEMLAYHGCAKYVCKMEKTPLL